MNSIIINGVLIVISARVILWIAVLFYKRFLATPLDVKVMGKWALVTGSTDGIGKAYAEALASRGLSIILLSRNLSKLQSVAKEIETKYGVQTKVIELDFTSQNYFERICQDVKDLEIGVLVNNVGMSYEHPEEFLSLEDEKQISQYISVNISSVNNMVRAILPQMLQRGKGVIINISSLTGLFPTPLLSVYSASKAYVHNFTEGLQMEYGGKGIIIQCVLPGFVVSNMSKIKKSSLLVPSPQDFVSSALSRLGIESTTNGYWAHDLMALLILSLPKVLSRRLIYSQLNSVRMRALRKKR